MTNLVFSQFLVIYIFCFVQDDHNSVTGSIRWKVEILCDRRQTMVSTDNLFVTLYTLKHSVRRSLGRKRGSGVKHVRYINTDDRFGQFDVIYLWIKEGHYYRGHFQMQKITFTNTNTSQEVFVHECRPSRCRTHDVYFNSRDCRFQESPARKHYKYKNSVTVTCIDCNCDATEPKCDHRTGECAGACALGFRGLYCNESCLQGTYGRGCRSECSIGCVDRECHSISGQCNCTAGFVGERCEQLCRNGFYGLGCREKCGKCRNEEACNKHIGVCEHGCAHGYIGAYCDPCSNSTWGEDCKSQCNCYRNYPCNVTNGDCGSSGCALHWVGTPCDTFEPCDAAHYGKACILCGKCREKCSSRHKIHCQAECDQSSGFCTVQNGCLPHFTGKKCDVCMDIYYGRDCRYHCGHCAPGEICDTVTGFCAACAKGYMGLKCDTECGHQLFGYECEELCTDKCIDNECDVRDGTCTYGCILGWKGDHCSEPETCDSLHYGEECDIPCSNCFDSICRRADGTCEYGCIAGHWGDRCDSTCRSGTYGKDCLKTCGDCRNGEDCDITTGECPHSCSGFFQPPLCVFCPPENFGPDCTGQCGHCSNGTGCHGYTGVCIVGCADGFTGHYCESRKIQDIHDDSVLDYLDI